ncbi:hypothetical protein PENSPDRAFT_693966 [Peniophora sp. CONT]|nr:hypothetical protein PENSPDRAFT_693966 [Peniophora sp. CONT]
MHENYQLVLTRTEKALHRDRVERAQPFYEERVRHERALNPAYVDLGMRRIDLLEGKVVFIGCQWRHPCQEYPEGSWTLLFLPPPRKAPSSAPVQASLTPTLPRTTTLAAQRAQPPIQHNAREAVHLVILQMAIINKYASLLLDDDLGWPNYAYLNDPLFSVCLMTRITTPYIVPTLNSSRVTPLPSQMLSKPYLAV